MQIFQGVSPLDYALEKFSMEVDLIDTNADLKRVLQACMHKDYSKRPSAEQLFNDPFFAGYTND
jgi:serine/threonine protein kinase